jgi:lysophospholipase L1-like esterase
MAIACYIQQHLITNPITNFRKYAMFTNKNTPLLISTTVAAVFIVIGLFIGTSLAIGISIFLAAIVIVLGLISRRMTAMWLNDDVRLWAREIRRFQKADSKEMPPENAVVFYGSSTIRFWSTLAQDMKPLTVIQRGFGGSRILDAVYYADKVVIPYHPSAIVVFSGTNDIAGKIPKSAQYVADKFKELCEVIQNALPETPIYYIAITPTPGRWQHWPIVQEANNLIASYTAEGDNLHFIDTTADFLDENGQPKRDLYRWDKIHLKADGYKILTAAVHKALLDE